LSGSLCVRLAFPQVPQDKLLEHAFLFDVYCNLTYRMPMVSVHR